MRKAYTIFCGGVDYDALPLDDRITLEACPASGRYDRVVDTASMLRLSEAGLCFVLDGIEDVARDAGREALLDAQRYDEY